MGLYQNDCEHCSCYLDGDECCDCGAKPDNYYGDDEYVEDEDYGWTDDDGSEESNDE